MVTLDASTARRAGTLLRLEPARVAAVTRAVLTVAVVAGLDLTDQQTGAVLAFTTTAVTLLAALSVRPVKWPLLAGYAEVMLIAVLTFIADVDQATVAAVVAATQLVLGSSVVREVVTPETKRPALR